jgi:hypothetical protein
MTPSDLRIVSIAAIKTLRDRATPPPAPLRTVMWAESAISPRYPQYIGRIFRHKARGRSPAHLI